MRIAMLLLLGSMFGTVIALTAPTDLNSVLGAPFYLVAHVPPPPPPKPIFADQQAGNWSASSSAPRASRRTN